MNPAPVGDTTAIVLLPLVQVPRLTLTTGAMGVALTVLIFTLFDNNVHAPDMTNLLKHFAVIEPGTI